MKRFLAIILLPVIIISCSQSDMDMFEKGSQALDDGNLTSALESFGAIVEKNSESPYGYYGLALLNHKENLPYEAIEKAYQSLKKDSLFLPALLLNSELALDINRPDLAFYFAVLYQENGGDSLNGIMAEFNALFFAGKFVDCRQFLDSRFQQFPDSPEMLVQNARLLLHSGEYKKAIEECHKAILSEKPGILKAVGDFYRELGLYDSASVYYEQALSKKSEPYFEADIADAYVSLGYLDRARLLTENSVLKTNESHRYYQLQHDIFLKQGKDKNAVRIYGMPIQKYNQNLSYKCNFAEAKARIGEGLGGGNYFMTAVQMAGKFKYPQVAGNDIYRRQIRMLIDAKRYNEAGPIAEQRLDSLPGDFLTLYDLAYLIFHVPAEESVRRNVLKKLDQTSRDNLIYDVYTGDLYLNIDSLRKAHNIFVDVLNRDKRNRMAILGEIEILIQSAQPTQALEFINSFDEYISYDPEIAAKKIELYEQLGNLETALQFARQLIEIGPGDISRYQKAIELAAEKKDKAQVEELYQLCLERNQNNPDALAMIAQYYFDKGEIEKSEEFVTQALSRDSLHIASLILKADLAAHRGEIDQAIEQYDAIVDLDDYAGDAYGHMAALLIESENERDLKRARDMSMRAIFNNGGNGLFRCTYGRALYKLGKYDQAVGAFRHAVRFEPGNPEVSFYAGMNQVKNKKPTEARQLLKNALSLGLSGDLKSEAEAALKKL